MGEGGQVDANTRLYDLGMGSASSLRCCRGSCRGPRGPSDGLVEQRTDCRHQSSVRVVRGASGSLREELLPIGGIELLVRILAVAVRPTPCRLGC
jgi:hypothetical protein